MKAILVSAAIIGAVATLAVGATVAYYSDIETSSSNTFTTATLDLKADNKDGTQVIHITRANMSPNAHWSHSYGGQWILRNAGSIPGKFKVKITNIKNYENNTVVGVCSNPEIKAGDITCGSGIDQGELGSLMYGKWMENPTGYSPAKGWPGTPMFNPINSAKDVVVDGIVLNPGDIFSAYLDLEWDTHSGTQDNLGQGDSLEFDVEFSLEQVH